MEPTDIADPEYFHRVVDCQWACPAHTPVPEYIRLIAERRYTEAYLINWHSNVFPGILGRTCDRPCEPACRRTRTDEKPVAICRLKRVAADYRGDIEEFMPEIPKKKNGKRIACVGAGPASLTVARDLLPLGYEVVIFEADPLGGGMMRSQIPSFRLPIEVLEEEVGRIVDMGVECHFDHRIDSMKALLEEDFDAIFVGSGAPRGRDLDIPGRKEADEFIDIGIDWLSSVAFGHTTKVEERVIILGGGNTAMDCCRTSKRIGGVDVKIVVRSGFDVMKASEWEKEDAMAEDIPFYNNHVPKEFLVEDGKLKGVVFEKVEPVSDGKGGIKSVPTGEPWITFECDRVLMAIGQENSFPWIERDIGIDFGKWELAILDEETLQSSNPKVFFGGDAALGPENIIWAAAHGHRAAISIDKFCQGEDVADRPPPHVNLLSQKMGMHEWSYTNDITNDARFLVPKADKFKALGNIKLEVELGFDERLAFKEAQRCLNCDVQTVFTDNLCIECNACVDICPMDCITFADNGEETDLRGRLMAPAENLEQDLYVSGPLATGQVMVKDEDLCLHCGLCAERCPTTAWDMQKFLINEAQAWDDVADPQSEAKTSEPSNVYG